MARQKVRVLGSMRPELSAAGSIMTALLALFAPLTVRSQGLPPGEMSVDRPDFTESTGTTVESHRQPQRSNGLSIGRCLPGRLRSFWEIYHVSPGDGDHTGQVFADTGLARPVGDNVQVDIAVGRSVRGPAPGWFVTAGFAVRTVRLRVSRPH